MKWLLIALLLAGCDTQGAKSPEQAETRITGKYEGCTMYYTTTLSGPNITWVRCAKEPKVVSAVHTENCGKSCTRTVTTSTVEEQ